MDSDHVADTVNYAALLDVVRQEMALPSQLLEHVAGRIVRSVFRRFPLVTSVRVELTKLNPPFGMLTDGAGVELNLSRVESKV
jgi:dihydroneopterin aldolase